MVNTYVQNDVRQHEPNPISLNAYIFIYQAAAYYFHGLILDEGNTEKSHGMAAAALQASEEFLKESKKACAAFNAVPPTSRSSNELFAFFSRLFFSDVSINRSS